tara:strand:- start:80 stop:436 length:357 start_codon:yes stop_codon:yes gene_type:complete
MGHVKAYLLDAIDSDGYAENPVTDRAKFQFAVDTFQSEKGWELVRGKNIQEAVADWFAGLPTACGIDHQNHVILELARDWGSLDDTSTDKEEITIIENWFNFMACKFLQVARKEGAIL